MMPSKTALFRARAVPMKWRGSRCIWPPKTRSGSPAPSYPSMAVFPPLEGALSHVDLDLFEPFDGLIEIEVLGRRVEVPDNNCLLRSLQYVAGDSIAYGRFCWNDECGNCEVTCVSPGT